MRNSSIRNPERIVSDDQLVQLLTQVNLPDLAERFGGFDIECDWEKVLSLANASAWRLHVRSGPSALRNPGRSDQCPRRTERGLAFTGSLPDGRNARQCQPSFEHPGNTTLTYSN